MHGVRDLIMGVCGLVGDCFELIKVCPAAQHRPVPPGRIGQGMRGRPDRVRLDDQPGWRPSPYKQTPEEAGRRTATRPDHARD